jgi:phosphoribosylamine--glycine ligase
MAKFLFVSCLGESVGLAIRLKAEGHEVLYYIHSNEEKDCGDGFLDKVDDWRKYVEEADVVFFDDVDQKQEGDSVYKSSAWSLEVREKYPEKLVIGGGHPDVGKLENDRMFAQSIMEQYGIPTVPMERFTSFADARKFVEENGGAWALKHNSQVDRDLAHVAKDPEDMIEFLNWLETNWNDLGNGQPVDFVLQQAVDGIEFAVTAFFDGSRFRDEACYLNQEEKKLLNHGNGPSTGQTGEIGLIVPNARLFRETLAKIEPFLLDKEYIGWADINCIITGPDQVVPLEFTIGRPGYPTLYSWCECLAEPVGNWLIRMAQQDIAPIQTRQGFNCTVVLATGTFPEQHPKRNRLAVVRGLEKVGLRHVWLGEVRWENGRVYGAGDVGYLAVVTGMGRTIPEAAVRVYDILDDIDVIPYKKIRTDIGVRAVQEFPVLKDWGWLM